MSLLSDHCPFCGASKWRWHFACGPCFRERFDSDQIIREFFGMKPKSSAADLPFYKAQPLMGAASPPPGAELVASVTHTWGETAKPPMPVKLDVEERDPREAVFGDFDATEDALGTYWPRHR